MIGTSAPNSAATATVAMANQKPALRRGAVKRRETGLAVRAPGIGARPLATPSRRPAPDHSMLLTGLCSDPAAA
jgi:hypothetical protein